MKNSEKKLKTQIKNANQNCLVLSNDSDFKISLTRNISEPVQTLVKNPDMDTNIKPKELKLKNREPIREIRIYVNKDDVTSAQKLMCELSERCIKCGKRKEPPLNTKKSSIKFKIQNTQTASFEEVLNEFKEGLKPSPYECTVNNIEFSSASDLNLRTYGADKEPFGQNPSFDDEASSTHSQTSQTLTIEQLLEKIYGTNIQESQMPKENQIRNSWLNSTVSFSVLAGISIYCLIEMERIRPLLSYANIIYIIFTVYSLMGIWTSSKPKPNNSEISDRYTKAVISQISTTIPFLAAEIWITFFQDDFYHKLVGHIYAIISCIPLFMYSIMGVKEIQGILNFMVAVGLGFLGAIFLLLGNSLGLATVVIYAVPFAFFGDYLQDINSPKQAIINFCNCGFLCLASATLREFYLNYVPQ